MSGEYHPISENAVTCICICTIALCIAAIWLGTGYILNGNDAAVRIEAIKAGLHQEYSPGNSQPIWTKPKVLP